MNGRTKAGRASATWWTLPLGLIGIGVAVGASACGSKFTSCEEQETCENPDLPTNPKGNGGEGGAEGGATCSENPSICSERATCKTTDGVTSCVCDDGYEGDGFACDDIDECAEGDGPCDENATCTNTPGGFECACNEGYFGTGSALSADSRYTFLFTNEQLVVENLVSGVETKPTLRFADVDLYISLGDRISVSDDGRYLAFESSVRLEGDYYYEQIFVHDLSTKTTTLASVSSSFEPANSRCLLPTLSGNGRFVAFISSATNLTPHEANGHSQVFVRDLVAGTTTLVSVNPLGMPGDGRSTSPSLFHDGRFVAFASSATDLVVGDTNGFSDIFVRDLVEGVTVRVSVSSLGEEADEESYQPAISADGRVVAFVSGASNLAPGTSGERFQVFRRVFRPE